MESNPHSGEKSLSIYFDTAGISPLRWYGINRIDDLALQPIPALVSPDFIEYTEAQTGDLVRIKVKVSGRHEWDPVTFRIMGVIDYFPTLYEAQEAGFLLTLKDPLFEQINLYLYSPIKSNELLLAATNPEETRTTLLESGLFIDQVLSTDSILIELRTNPLTIGLRSVTLFGYILTTILSLVGFTTHFYLSTRQRAVNFSILRALGLSPQQLYTTLLFEQIILMLFALALGTVLGMLLNQLTLTGLPLRLGELDTIPPFTVQTNWILLLRVYFTLGTAFLISLGLAIIFLWRIQIHRVLRIGEE
jgi:ABC-type antimicrobial peptide transport system permease subunit